MKKFLFFAAVLMMAACGSKTGNNANGADSTVKDSVLTTETALSTEKTEADIQKTIETQLQTVYAKLREMDASGNGINVNELDQQFCSEEFLRLQKEVYEDLAAAQQANYREGPTYRLKDGEPSGLYGQRNYAEGEIISGEVYQDYTSTVSSMSPAPTGQAEVDNAYVALEDYGTTQAGNAISKEAYNALPAAAKSNFEPAMVCINTIQLGDEDYVLLGELVSGTDASLDALAAKYKAYNNGKTNTDPVDDAGALQYIKDNLSTAYICTTAGLYGGQYFKAGENYSALKAWCSLTESRDKFKFNYDAFDVLIDPTYPGEGHTSVYHDPYDETKPVEYVAVYSGSLGYTYIENDGVELFDSDICENCPLKKLIWG